MSERVHDSALAAHIVYLAGPTAAGKSEIAVELAERMGAEIIGVDAFQIYRGLDLLTAKPNAALQERAPHHLIGEVALDEPFDVVRFVAAAQMAARAIVARGKVPLAVGGTGFYFRALMHGLDELPPPDETLRSKLNELSLAELQQRYRALDPAGALRIDLQNNRRLVRALEVCLLSGRPFSSFRRDWSRDDAASSPAFHAIYLQRERAELFARIDARVVQMFADGVRDEVRALPANLGTAAQTLGLREVLACERGELSEPEAVAAIQRATRHYAKRQETWFRRQPEFVVHRLEAATTAGETAAQLASYFRAAGFCAQKA